MQDMNKLQIINSNDSNSINQHDESISNIRNEANKIMNKNLKTN